jgi:hypothetical protein
MKELNRRETLYGKKVKKKSNEDDEDEDKHKNEDKEDEEPVPVVKKDKYALDMPKFQTVLTDE